MQNIVNTIMQFLNSVSAIAYPFLILDIVVSGIVLMLPSQKFRGLAAGFLIFGIVGFILVLGSSQFATEIQNNVTF